MAEQDRIEQIRAEINALPKPYSQEEQYMYALICDTAGVQPKEGYLANNTTFKNPFWRMQQYWHAFCQATELRLDLPTIPSADTVSLDSLREEVQNKLLSDGNVNTSNIANGSVTEPKLSSGVASLLLGSKRVTEAMLADAVATRLLASGRITEDMLASALANKLLGEGKVTKSMLSSEVQDILNKVN